MKTTPFNSFRRTLDPLPLASLLFLFTTAVSFAVTGTVHEYHFPATKEAGALDVDATYRLWIPNNVETLRGIIVHQHGCGDGASKGGATAHLDLHWQTLAARHGCALLAPQYAFAEPCHRWCDPANGSEDGFLNALANLATLTKHPELENIPWCLWGHSGGAFWASVMTARHPERTVASFLRSGSGFFVWDSDIAGDKREHRSRPRFTDAWLQSPVMCNVGIEEREHERFQAAWKAGHRLFSEIRAQGGYAAFAPDPSTSHECGNSRFLAIPFFGACLRERLPAQPGDPLKPMPTHPVWHGTWEGKESVFAAPRLTGDLSRTSWLPDSVVAGDWTAYLIKGEPEDETPPARPSDNLGATVDGTNVVLTWNACADLESGIASFRIYRDDARIADHPDKSRPGKSAIPQFQRISYHDTPEEPLPELRYVDTSASPGTTHSYQITTVNGTGLESDRSEAVRVTMEK